VDAGKLESMSTEIGLSQVIAHAPRSSPASCAGAPWSM
jgi:hypothetical protein